MKALALAAALATLLAAPALAQECSEGIAESRLAQLNDLLAANPDIAANIGQYRARVNAHYGRPPVTEEFCGSTQMLINMIKSARDNPNAAAPRRDRPLADNRRRDRGSSDQRRRERERAPER